MKLADIQSEHKIHNQELQRVKDKIEMRQKQIYRLERKKERAYENSHWTTQLVNPVMREVAKLTPHITWKIEDNPFVSGMRCQCHVFGKTEDNITVGICFTPRGESNLNFDTKEKHIGYAKGSIGDMNGFDNKSKLLESIQELVDLVDKTEQEERKIKEEA
tara:strand:- start:465 stop:947 length:483 start_codon:yes stop_codon:yes gene_type:complete